MCVPPVILFELHASTPLLFFRKLCRSSATIPVEKNSRSVATIPDFWLVTDFDEQQINQNLLIFILALALIGCPYPELVLSSSQALLLGALPVILP